MKKSAPLLLTVILAGLVAGGGSWEQNKVYTYRVETATLKHSSEFEDGFFGVTSGLYLTIRPRTDDLLIGQITQAEYSRMMPKLSDDDDQNSSDSDDKSFKKWPLSRPFKIHLRNGVIQSLEVDNSLTDYELNQLKVIMSQFQVDTTGQNGIIASDENQLPQVDSNNAFYKTMESLASGDCETIYDISPIADYLVKTHPEWIPLHESEDKAGEFIQIIKTRNYSNCRGSKNYLLNIAAVSDGSKSENDLYIAESRRIVVSGSLQRYTIQSAFTVNKVMNSRCNIPIITDYVNCSLVYVYPEVASRRSQVWPENMKIVENLIYNFDAKMDVKYQQPRLSLTSVRAGVRWTACWTLFMTGENACNNEFGSGYHFTGSTRPCGPFHLGSQYECRN